MALNIALKTLQPTAAENHANAFSAVSDPDRGHVMNAVLSCQVSVGASALLFVPDTEAKRVTRETSEARRESRRLKVVAARISGWPAWVRPDYVRAIQQLGCHEQVRDLLERGYGLVAIANKIHEYEELTRCAVGTIENYLTHYRATVPKHLMARRVLKVPEAEQALRKGVDVRHKLIELYAKMEERIEIGFKREKQMSFLITGMEKQFEVAAKLLKDIYQFEKEQGFGEYGSAARDGRVSAPVPQLDLDKVYSRTGINEIMQDPAKRMRIVACVERLLDLGKKADEMNGLDKSS